MRIGIRPVATESGRERRVPWWFVCALILGLYLSARGYHSLDGDQAYRLPLLLHRQEPHLYEDDPFVRACDAFNPHRGSLIVLDAVTRPLGLSAGLFVLFALTFLLTCRAVERLAREVWPESGPNVGWVAVGMLLAAKAGNIGTNHLFEAMVLDRLIAFALGWQALAHAVSNPEDGWWRPPVAIGLATWIHPSVGLQLAMVLAASWLFWSLLGRGMGVSAGAAIRGSIALMFAVMPGLAINLPRGTSLVGRTAGGRVLALECRASEPAAHASAPLANAAMVVLVLLSRAGIARAGQPVSHEDGESQAGDARGAACALLATCSSPTGRLAWRSSWPGSRWRGLPSR